MRTEKTPSSTAVVVVSLRWNGEALRTRALSAGERVVLGDARGALAPLPETALGSAALAVADNEGGPHLRVPEGKVASIANGRGRVRLIAGPARVGLVPGDEGKLVFGAFELGLAVDLPEPAKPRRKLAAGAWLHVAAVAAVHAALLAASSRAALASSFESESGPDVEQLRGYLAAAEERSAATPDVISTDGRGDKESKKSNGHHGNGKDGGGERASGEAGKAGATTSRAQNRRFGAAPAPEKGTASSAASEIEAARSFGMVGLLSTAEASAVPRMDGASPWGAADPFTAFGGLFGRSTGDSAGVGGLTLTGTGEGGGGRGDGIGLGTIGTIGHTDGFEGLGTGGAGTAQMGSGFGSISSHWHHIGGTHRAKAPTVRWGHWGHGGWSGRLPPEAVQRVIRANFGRFRGCYAAGLLASPGLAGRVSTSFVIGRDGAVMSVSDAGSTLPNAAVSACVRRAFYGLSFPQPEGGIVSVVYPIVFSSLD